MKKLKSLALFIFLLYSTLVSSQQEDALIAPITKDESTNLYSLTVYLKTPLQATNLHLDLGASLTWVDCTRRYKSSSYQHLLYNTSLCISLDTRVYGNCFKPPGPGCFNDSCEYFPENSVTRTISLSNILIDTLALSAIGGPHRIVTDFVFSCSRTKLLRGLAKGVTGVAALGRFNYSLPFQLSRGFDSPPVFAVCLPSSGNGNGVAVFNSAGDYNISLMYTPLILNPVAGTVVFYTRPSDEYFIGVTAVKINGKLVELNKTLLEIDGSGFGGTKISTSTPYTVLQTEIFTAVTERFAEEMNVTAAVGTVEPFGVCFAAEAIENTRVGPAVPVIELVMGEGSGVVWRIFGSNSMVRVKAQGVDGWCLGFVDGGPNPRTSIVIGGKQMEDNLLQFDLEQKRLGFSSYLLLRSTSCANFNFTTRNN